VIVPCDYLETKKATIALGQINGPAYFRFAREKTPIMTTTETPFRIGKAEIFKEGTHVALIGSGPVLYNGLLAALELEQEGISVLVINNHTIKPIDVETITWAAKLCGAVVTLEEHQIMGGAGSAVAEVLAQNYPVPIEMVGVGSNNFSDAYQAYKPLLINSTEAWGTEFVYGFGLVPTFIASHGVLGSLLWILLFVFFGIIATKILKNLPSDAEKRFMLLSSFTISAFLWLLAFITVPGHAVLLLTFVITAIFVSLGISYGVINESVYSPAVGSKIYKLFASIVALVILILIVWGLVVRSGALL
jgi:hypothetical protein